MRLIDADMLIEEIEKIALEVEQQTQGRSGRSTWTFQIPTGFIWAASAMTEASATATGRF